MKTWNPSAFLIYFILTFLVTSKIWNNLLTDFGPTPWSRPLRHVHHQLNVQQQIWPAAHMGNLDSRNHLHPRPGLLSQHLHLLHLRTQQFLFLPKYQENSANSHRNGFQKHWTPFLFSRLPNVSGLQVGWSLYFLKKSENNILTSICFQVLC